MSGRRPRTGKLRRQLADGMQERNVVRCLPHCQRRLLVMRCSSILAQFHCGLAHLVWCPHARVPTRRQTHSHTSAVAHSRRRRGGKREAKKAGRDRVWQPAFSLSLSLSLSRSLARALSLSLSRQSPWARLPGLMLDQRGCRSKREKKEGT